MILRFIAYGLPQPKGSAKAFIPKGWTRAVVTSDNAKNKGWQQVVAEAASAALQQQKWTFVTDQPIRLTVGFRLKRPKAIKDKSVPHLKKPDLDKLVRSVKDALTGVVWADDSLVDEIEAFKGYAPVGMTPGVVVRVDVYSQHEIGTLRGEPDASAKATLPGRGGDTGRSALWGD